MEMWTGGKASDRTIVACGVLSVDIRVDIRVSHSNSSPPNFLLLLFTMKSKDVMHMLPEWGSQSSKTTLPAAPNKYVPRSSPVGENVSSPVYPGPLIGPHWLVTTTPEPITVDQRTGDANCQAQGQPHLSHMD